MTRKPKSLEELKRKKSECAPYTRVLIITEGEKTEPIYFEELRKHYQLSAVNIQIIGSGSDPKNITNKIKKIKESEKSKSEKFDTIYCVFDHDIHTHFENSSSSLNEIGVRLARSWPCFEYWYLCHFEYSRFPFQSSQECKKIANKKLNMNEKNNHTLFEKLSPTLEKAIENAKKAKNDADITSEKNPSTEVHELVLYLKNLNS